MDIYDLTLRQAKTLSDLFAQNAEKKEVGLSTMIGQKVIVRTYSAGVFFGELIEKSGTEVILKNARRMYYWKANKGISLSACALYGVSDESKIVEAVPSQWLDAIEIIPCSDIAITSLEGASNVEAS